MMMHPDLMMAMMNERHRELIAEADSGRLLTIARRARVARRAGKAPALRGQPTGTLTSCEPSAAVPAR